MRNFFRYWKDPDYWLWRWDRMSDGAGVGIVVALAFLVALGGYMTANVLADSTDPTAASATQKVVVTRVQTVAVSAPGQTVMREVTVQQAGRERVVTSRQTQTVVQSRTVERPVTVTNAITRAVTGPTRTVTGPTQTVENQIIRIVTGPTQTVTDRNPSPGRSVTVAGSTRTVTGPTRTVTSPTQTVTRTVTQPARTVTETMTSTVTTTVTETVTRPPKN